MRCSRVALPVEAHNPNADFHKLLGQLAFTRCSASCSARPHYQESWRSRVPRHDRITKKGGVHELLRRSQLTTASLVFTSCSASRSSQPQGWCSQVARPAGVHELLGQSKLTTPRLTFTNCSASLRLHVARPVARHDRVHGLLGTTALPRKVGQLAFTRCSASCSARPHYQESWRSRVARHDRITKKGGVHELLGLSELTTARLMFTSCSASRSSQPQGWCSQVARPAGVGTAA